jgi:ubiquinone/menaquinone biosynthesis C-methylase UbiE
VGNQLNRIGIFLTQVVFSIITPSLLIPSISKLRITRSIIAFCFGRSYGNRYQDIIDSFQGRYELAMSEGLQKARTILGGNVSVVLDCGTGTGFVTNQAAKQFPDATFIAFDILQGMLRQARKNCKNNETDVFHLQADSFRLPLADESVDLILAQNTMPCFTEYARVCRPGGVVVYVDSSSGWITKTAKRLVERYQLFETVMGERVDMGFCIMAKKSGFFKPIILTFESETNHEKLVNLLRCPIDKSRLTLDGDYFCCEYQHQFPIQDGFPVLLAEKVQSKKK